jgi:predicted nuclease of predicted toxin-antitoxin system
MVVGHPPKVIWLRIGNCSVRKTADLLRERYIVIQRFHEDARAAFLALSL